MTVKCMIGAFRFKCGIYTENIQSHLLFAMAFAGGIKEREIDRQMGLIIGRDFLAFWRCTS